MEAQRTCGVEACGHAAVLTCARCGTPVCEQHRIADYRRLPGGQRTYCLTCDADRRQLYQTVRSTGLRALVWSTGGAIGGSAIGFVLGHAVTSDGFAHTVTIDAGFVAGLSLALAAAVSSAARRANSGNALNSRPTPPESG